jgi:hypothetical protein
MSPPKRGEHELPEAEERMATRNANGAHGATLDAATMRAVRKPSARLALVRAVRDGGLVTVEKDWIEWKSQVNLRDKRSRMEHVIRHILGFGNRDPGRAARIAGGCAYLLLGVEPRTLDGVDQVDPAVLEQWVRPYLEPNGPEWDADYVELDGKAVLVITVEPPRWGDTAFLLRRALDPYEDGTIFVRRLGKTERASAAEIDRLFARAARGEQALQVKLDWWGNPNVITPVEIRAQDTQAWVDAERVRLLSPLQQHLRRAAQSPGAMAIFSGPYESRSAEEYQQEVEDYLAKAAQIRPRQVHRIALLKGLGAMALAIENDTMYNFPAVEVRLAFPAEVIPYLDEDDALPYSEIPQPPEPFGSRVLASSLLGLGNHASLDPCAPGRRTSQLHRAVNADGPLRSCPRSSKQPPSAPQDPSDRRPCGSRK